MGFNPSMLNHLQMIGSKEGTVIVFCSTQSSSKTWGHKESPCENQWATEQKGMNVERSL